LKDGKVVLSDWSVVDCLIRNLSEVGARLEFSGPTTLPRAFRVLIVSSNLIYPAEVEWQRGLSAGICFTGPGSVPPRKIT
jgi:hypothetical protein